MPHVYGTADPVPSVNMLSTGTLQSGDLTVTTTVEEAQATTFRPDDWVYVHRASIGWARAGFQLRLNFNRNQVVAGAFEGARTERLRHAITSFSGNTVGLVLAFDSTVLYLAGGTRVDTSGKYSEMVLMATFVEGAEVAPLVARLLSSSFDANDNVVVLDFVTPPSGFDFAHYVPFVQFGAIGHEKHF